MLKKLFLIVLTLNFASICESHVHDSKTDFSCYQLIANKSVSILSCVPSPLLLLDAVADYISSQTTGSSVESWILLGTHMYDVLNVRNEIHTLCDHATLPEVWVPALSFAKKAIRTASRLLSDPNSSGSSSPIAGTHGSLSLAKALLHPCAFAPLSPAQRRTVARSRHAASGNTNRPATALAEAALQSASDARRRGDCNASIQLAHHAADAAPDSVQAWYNLQVPPCAFVAAPPPHRPVLP